MDKERKGFPGKELADWAVGVGQNAKNKISKAADTVKESREQMAIHSAEIKIAKDRLLLRPVFLEDLSAPNFTFPPLVCIAEPDERHQKSPACKDAIGFLRNEEDLQILNLYPEYVDSVGLRFYPAADKAAFYVDNSQPNFYVNLDEYFEFQKKARIDELENIAFCLGAKHVEARLIEAKRTEEASKDKADVKGGRVVKAGASRESSQAEASRWEVALSSDFDGSDNPKRPVLHYFQNEASVQNLIAMRMNPEHKIKSKTYSWDFSHSSGIKESTAVKIENAVKKMKLGMSASVVKKARTEKRTMLKYTIDF